MKKKYSYDFVKLSFEKEGYSLLSKEYKNNSTYLRFICPNGHKHKIKWYAWQRGHRCGKCSGNIKLTYEQVKQSFEEEGYTLLSKEYINNKQYLDYICPNGHKHKIKWNNWQQGNRCGRCKGNIKVIYDQIKQSFEKEGYTLLTKEYVNAQEYLDFICPNGHEHKIIWNAWQQGIRCGKCDIKWSKGEKEISEYIKNKYCYIVKENDRTLIKNTKTNNYLELDIWLPEINKAIEYNGNYYHKEKEMEFRDNYKKQWCQENNIDLLVIEDEQWRKNKDWNKINNFIGE